MKLKIYLALEQNSCLFALFKEGKGHTCKKQCIKENFSSACWEVYCMINSPYPSLRLRGEIYEYIIV